jgi:adenylate kinase family enzyme
MVKMLHGEFPGTIGAEGLLCKNTTCLVGPPSCGKTKLLKILELASKHVAGFVFEDMSAIIDWHKNPVNMSPFRADFSGEADRERQQGNLVNDTLICQGLEYRLLRSRDELRERIQEPSSEIRKLLLSGAPRTKTQFESIRNMLGNVTLVGIKLTEEQADQNRLKRIADGEARPDDVEPVFRNRWVKYRTSTEPFITWAQENGLIHMFDFNMSLGSKAYQLLKLMHLELLEFRSMHRQLANKDCDAYWEIMKIDNYKAYKKHMESKSKVPSEDWHRGPSPTCVKQAFARV